MNPGTTETSTAGAFGPGALRSSSAVAGFIPSQLEKEEEGRPRGTGALQKTLGQSPAPPPRRAASAPAASSGSQVAPFMGIAEHCRRRSEIWFPLG